MAVKVTRCPHCQTSFRVREEQLDTARGMVRCGSCLQVFKAAHYFQSDASNATPNATPNATQNATQTAAEKPEGSKKTTAAVKRKPKPKQPEPQQPEPSELIHDDMEDDPISEVLEDDPNVDFNLKAPEPSSPKKKAPSDSIDLDTSALDNFDPESFFYTFEAEEDDTDESSDEAWAAALLEDSDEETPSAPAQSNAERMYTAQREADDFVGFADDNESNAIDLEGLALRPKLDIASFKNPTKNPTDNVADLQAEPLTLSSDFHKRQIPWGWLSGVFLLLIVAAVQVFYFNFDRWARSPQWRPYYIQACGYLDCTVPKVQNINNMSTQHLVVQTHPKLKGALMVDTLLYNKADHTQPFPDLLLVFRDINEQVIASRRFTPNQFLAGELAGEVDMSPLSHTHIALEIVDPGPEAVSYHIDLLANH